MKLLAILTLCIICTGSLKSQDISHAFSIGLTHTGLDVDLTKMEGAKRNEGFNNSKIGFGINYNLELSVLKNLAAFSGLEYKVNNTSFTRMHVENNSNPDKPVTENLKFTRFILPVGIKYYVFKNDKLRISGFGGINCILMNTIFRKSDYYNISFPSLGDPSVYKENINSKFNDNEASMGFGYLAGLGSAYKLNDVELTIDLQYRSDLSNSRISNIPIAEAKGSFFTRLKWFELNFGVRF